MSRQSRPLWPTILARWARIVHPVGLHLTIVLVSLTMPKNESVTSDVKLTFNCYNPNEIATFKMKLTSIISHNINVHIYNNVWTNLSCFRQKWAYFGRKEWKIEKSNLATDHSLFSNLETWKSTRLIQTENGCKEGPYKVVRNIKDLLPDTYNCPLSILTSQLLR